MALRPIASPTFPEVDALPRRPPEPSPGTGARVWLVRHAQVHADWESKAYGNLDVPLSEAGVAATRAMSEAFAAESVAHVQSSDLARALAMGQGIARTTRAPLVLDKRLREIWRGDWQGIAADEFRARWHAESETFLADPWNWKGHAGESDADVFARAWPALLDAVRSGKGGTVALTSHFNVIRVLVSRALGLAPRESFAFRNAPAHATLLVDSPDGWKLVVQNVATPADAARL
jgi:broad specificity phosphatase PhoE